MRFPLTILILIWSFSHTESLPLAPPPPDFIADFSKRSAKSDLMQVVDEDELQHLRHNGFQDQLRQLREKNIGRDMTAPTEEMARVRNSIEDISEFSVDSTEIDEAIDDITVPTDKKLKKSSKFTELADIHNIDFSNTALPPFAFSEDGGESIKAAEKVEAVNPSTIVNTLPTSTSSTSTPSTSIPTKTTPSTTITTTTRRSTTSISAILPSTFSVPVINIDSDVEVPRTTTVEQSERTATVHLFTTTLPTASTTRYSLPTTTWLYPLRTSSPHIFSSSTIRLPSVVPLAGSSFPLIPTTPRPHRAIYTTEFTIEPRRSEGKTSELREKIKSTNQLLNLLGDRIGGIDQRAAGAPRTGVLTNIYDQGVVKRRNYRTKQWGTTGGARRAATYDGQFTGVAYGATKQRGGGFTMRKKMGRRGYRTKKLRPIVEKKTADVAIEYGGRRGEWIRGVKQSERRSAVRRVSPKEKSFAQAIFESEEASMRQLKKTLRQIRDVVKFKMSSTTGVVTSTTAVPTTTSRYFVVKKAHRLGSSFYNGIFDLRRRL